MTNVISFDPGGRTGLAYYVNGEFHSDELVRGLGGYLDWAAWQYEGDGWDDFDQITYESFTINARTHRLDPTAFEDTTSIIGCIRGDGHRTNTPVFRQSPGEAKKFATDDKLRTAGFYNRTTGGHANDAARHLLVRLFKLRVPEIMEKFA